MIYLTLSYFLTQIFENKDRILFKTKYIGMQKSILALIQFHKYIYSQVFFYIPLNVNTYSRILIDARINRRTRTK